MDDQTLGVILAGGTGTRMGADKALVELDGRPLAAYVASALADVVPRTVVVGRPGRLGALECYPDALPGRHGPLSGLATGLELAGASDPGSNESDPIRVLLVAVDQPLVRRETLERLVAEPGAAVVPMDGARQVTCAVYPAAWIAEARRELEAGGSIQSLLDRLPYAEVREKTWRAWGEDGRSWFSVDTPDDLATAALMLSGDR